jgi:hypothetical protein
MVKWKATQSPVKLEKTTIKDISIINHAVRNAQRRIGTITNAAHLHVGIAFPRASSQHYDFARGVLDTIRHCKERLGCDVTWCE